MQMYRTIIDATLAIVDASVVASVVADVVNAPGWGVSPFGSVGTC